MSVTMTKADGVTVLTVTSNPKSRCPLLCQILGTLCCSPFYFVSGGLKQQLGSSHTLLGTLQIMVGVITMGFGGIVRSVGWSWWLYDGCFWIGAVFIAAGIVCILVKRFPSPCLICFSILVNLASFGVAVTAIVYYSMELDRMVWNYSCERNEWNDGYRYGTTTTGPTTANSWAEYEENCERYKYMLKMTYGGMIIMMLMLSFLLVCVMISSCVLSVKALCKNYKENEMEDPELQKPLMDEVLSSPAC
uniref:Transmembrane protein 176B n=1 Tax=Astyanax mexicanus TaxID=7994 RepID=A0A3B1JUB3_ASTMX